MGISAIITNQEKEKADIIIKLISKDHGLDPEDVFRRTRKREIVTPRQMTHFFIRKHTVLSQENIGKTSKVYGRTYDHSTIRNSVITVKDLTDVDHKFRDNINRLNDLIKTELEEYKLNTLDPKREAKLLTFKKKVISACLISSGTDDLITTLKNLIRYREKQTEIS